MDDVQFPILVIYCLVTKHNNLVVSNDNHLFARDSGGEHVKVDSAEQFCWSNLGVILSPVVI